MALGRYASRSYLFALGTAFPLAAPFFAPGGGYGHIMDFKAALYLILTAAFVLVRLFDLPREKAQMLYALLYELLENQGYKLNHSVKGDRK